MKTADAVKHFGSASALARALGIARQAVGQWGPTVPPMRAFQIEVETCGALKASRRLPLGVTKGRRVK